MMRQECKHCWVGLKYCELSDAVDYIYSDNKRLDSLELSQNFTAFDYCPNCGKEIKEKADG